MVIFGIVGALGHLIGILADNFTAYSTNGVTRFIGLPYQLTTFFEYYEKLFINKSLLELVIGHYLAIFGISLGIYGFWFLFKTIKEESPILAKLMMPLMITAYFSGVVYHATFAFVGIIIQAKYSPGVDQELIQQILEKFNLFSIPLAIVLIGSFFIFSVLVSYIIISHKTIYPKWVALLNPILIQLFFTLISYILPLSLQVFFIISAYNLSIFIFYLVLVIIFIRNSK